MAQEPELHIMRGVNGPGLIYTTSQISTSVEFSPEVLLHFDRYRQLVPDSTEAGGQLFAQFDGRRIEIRTATGPRSTDRRSMFSFLPNRFAERREIKKLFKEGLHFVGDWHTHPQAEPQPSLTDIASTSEMFRRSTHELEYFVMVIVGTAQWPRGLHVALLNNKRTVQLTATPLA